MTDLAFPWNKSLWAPSVFRHVLLRDATLFAYNHGSVGVNSSCSYTGRWIMPKPAAMSGYPLIYAGSTAGQPRAVCASRQHQLLLYLIRGPTTTSCSTGELDADRHTFCSERMPSRGMITTREFDYCSRPITSQPAIPSLGLRCPAIPNSVQPPRKGAGGEFTLE